MMADLHSLIVQEIPKGRQDLIDSHTNLERVAEYCEANYIDSENRRGALEETKNFTTQSLASVAYQINTLAYNFIQMLDLQQQQISDMGSQITNIAQTVMVHKEKVARREIGVLTTNKTSTRQFKIIAPVNPERPIKYVRKPIDFGALDDIGHGVRVHGGSAGMARPVRQNSTSSQGSSGAASAGGGGVYASGPAPTTKPPTPPQPARSASTLSRNNKEYRTPPAIAPPQVPSNYAVNYPMGHPRRQEAGRAPGYSAVPRPAGPPPASPAPQVGMVHPMHHEQPTAAPGAGGESIYRSRSQRGSENGEPAYRPGMRMPSSSGMSVSAASTGGRSSTSSIQSMGPPPPPPMEPVGAAGHDGRGYGLSPHQPGAGMVGLSTLRLRSSAANSMPPPPSPLPQLSDPGSVRGGDHSPPLPPPPPETQPPAAAAAPAPAGGHYRSGGYQQQQSVVTDDSLPGWVPKDYIEKVVAVYDYTADKEDELSFSENSVIYVLKRNDDGWWEGVMDGVTGLFPGNYVEPLMS